MFRKYFSTVITILFAYFIFDYFLENKDKLESIKNINLNILSIALFFSPFVYFIRAILNRYLFKIVDIDLMNREAVEIVMKTTLGNLLGPFNFGSIYKIQYFKQKYSLNYAKYLALNTTYSLFTLLFFLVTLLLLPIFKVNNFNSIDFTGIIAIILISILTLFIFNFFKILSFFSKFIKFENILNDLTEGVRAFRDDYSSTLKIGFVFVLNIMYLLIYNYLVVYSIVPDITLFRLVIFICGINVIGVVKLTPGNFGVQELFLFSLYGLHEISIENIIFISFVLRSLSIVILIIYFIYGWFKKLVF